MTKKTIEKIESNGYYTPDTFSLLIYRARVSGNKDMIDEYRYKLRGYLRALVDVGFLTEQKFKAAYLWYFTKEHKN